MRPRTWSVRSSIRRSEPDWMPNESSKEMKSSSPRSAVRAWSTQYLAVNSSVGRADGSRHAAGCQPAPSRLTARWTWRSSAAVIGGRPPRRGRRAGPARPSRRGLPPAGGTTRTASSSGTPGWRRGHGRRPTGSGRCRGRADRPVGVGAGIEPHERDEQPDVGLGDLLAEQEAVAGQAPVELGERIEERGAGGPTRRRGERGGVDALVDGRADPGVERLDVVGQLGRVGVDRRRGERPELGGQVDADRLELVAGDRPGRAVPQRRHRHVPVEAGLGGVVGLAQQREAVHRVGPLDSRNAQPRASRLPST